MRLVILGSTGSIGRQAVEVVRENAGRIQVMGLSARHDYRTLSEQISEFHPALAAITDRARFRQLSSRVGEGESVELLQGPDSLEVLAAMEGADTVLNATVGAAGLKASVAALKAGKTLALANKESLVVGGSLVMSLARRNHQVLPVDSEHSAIFQCLAGEDITAVRRLVITGSGGPFRGRKPQELESVGVEEALAHPTWRMGQKITIDSATLMNKGLEVIEAHHLFGIPYDKIDVLIHPQSIIHSLVEFEDDSVKAQMGHPDMKLPIQYALTYPDRAPMHGRRLDLAEVGSLTFERPDLTAFPCLRLALEAGRSGKTYPAALNAANEVAVEAFLRGRISFAGIARVVEGVLSGHEATEPDSLDAVLEADRAARLAAEREVAKSSAGTKAIS